MRICTATDITITTIISDTEHVQHQLLLQLLQKQYIILYVTIIVIRR